LDGLLHALLSIVPERSAMTIFISKWLAIGTFGQRRMMARTKKWQRDATYRTRSDFHRSTHNEFSTLASRVSIFPAPVATVNGASSASNHHSQQVTRTNADESLNARAVW
jgi:hypothetical protein